MELADILKLLGVFLAGAGGGYVKDIVVGLYKSRGERAAAAAGVEQKKLETEPTLLQEIRQQLRECRQSERALQGQLYQIRTDMQTMWLALELILKKYPEAEDEVMTAVVKMKARQKEFLHDDEGDVHTTRQPESQT